MYRSTTHTEGVEGSAQRKAMPRSASPGHSVRYKGYKQLVYTSSSLECNIQGLLNFKEGAALLHPISGYIPIYSIFLSQVCLHSFLAVLPHTLPYLVAYCTMYCVEFSECNSA